MKSIKNNTLKCVIRVKHLLGNRYSHNYTNKSNLIQENEKTPRLTLYVNTLMKYYLEGASFPLYTYYNLNYYITSASSITSKRIYLFAGGATGHSLCDFKEAQHENKIEACPTE